MYEKLNSLFSSQGLKSSAIVSFGNVGSTALAGITFIILSRGLGPADFGIFSAAFSLVMIVSRVADLGINIATQRHVARLGSIEKSKGLVAYALIAKAAIAMLVAIGGWFSAPFIAHSFLKVDNVQIIRWSFALAWIFIAYDSVAALVQSIHKFGSYAVMSFLQSFAKIALVLVFLLTNLISPLTALFAYILSPLPGILYGLKNMPNIWSNVKINEEDKKTLWGVARWTSIAIISAAIADNIDVLIVKSMLSSHETGLFAAASRLAMFTGLIGISLGTVLNIRVAKYKDTKNLKTYLTKSKQLAILAIVASFLLIPLSTLALQLTSGIEYIGASSTLSILFVSTGITAATSPFVALFYLFDKPQFFAISGIVTSVVLITSDYLLIPQLGIIGAGWAKLLTRLIALLFTFYYARKAYAEHIAKV